MAGPDGRPQSTYVFGAIILAVMVNVIAGLVN